MENNNQKSSSDHLTQKDIVQLLLHNAQHMVTREELKSDINEVKEDIAKVETSLKQSISKLDDKISKVESSLKQDISKLDDKISKVDDRISKVETSLKQDISKLDDKIVKVGAKFDKIQWLIIGTTLTILLKDYIVRLL